MVIFYFTGGIVWCWTLSLFLCWSTNELVSDLVWLSEMLPVTYLFVFYQNLLWIYMKLEIFFPWYDLATCCSTGKKLYPSRQRFTLPLQPGSKETAIVLNPKKKFYHFLFGVVSSPSSFWMHLDLQLVDRKEGLPKYPKQWVILPPFLWKAWKSWNFNWINLQNLIFEGYCHSKEKQCTPTFIIIYFCMLFLFHLTILNIVLDFRNFFYRQFQNNYCRRVR